MEDAVLNPYLKQLAIAAQNAPPGSRQRRRSLADLIRTIQGSSQLSRPYQGQFVHLYEDIYAEATQQLFTYLCKNIESYRPEHEVMQWVNFLLKRRFFHAARQEFVPHYRSKTAHSSPEPWLNFDALEQGYPSPTSADNPSLLEQITDYLKTDPEQCLNAVHIRNHPHVTFQALALRILSGYKWHEISAEFDLPISTLCSFYRKQLKQFAPRMKAYLSQ
jgi:hypothetical protein